MDIKKNVLDFHHSLTVFDAHADTLLRVLDEGIQLQNENYFTCIDFPRLKKGGVKIQAFTAWVDPEKYRGVERMIRATNLIDVLYEQVKMSTPDVEMAFSGSQALEINSKGKIAVLLGLEGGYTLNNNMDNLYYFYERGVRYITFAWLKSLELADSSNDKPRWNGLSPFGKEVIKEMNRLGMIVDLSHISIQAAHQVYGITTKPVIYSHSCCRTLVDVPRNVYDDSLKLLKSNNGVIGINFYTRFLRSAGVSPERPVTVEDLIDHIDHAVEIAGIDCVGIGSDYDGTGQYPVGLEDCSNMPLLTEALIRRGYKEEDIRKIMGENFIRVFKAQESGN